MSKNKTAFAIAIFLMTTIAVSLISILPNAEAQVEEESWRSFIYVGVTPGIIGINQEVIIVAWTRDMPPEMGEELGLLDSPTSRAGWYDMTVTVTKPDNTTETLEFPYSDPVGAVWLAYTPDDIGTYTLRANFPGTRKEGTWYYFTGNYQEINRYYEPAVSDPVELVVQEEPIQDWQEPALPNDYWRRPINTANRNWYTIAGNWLSSAGNVWPSGSYGGNTANYAYGVGTETPHILWTRQYYFGGLMGDRQGSTGYITAQYGGLGFSGIVLNGVLYYTPRRDPRGNTGVAAVNLYTGEELSLDWDAPTLSYGQVYNYESPNQHGGYAYLWRTSGVTLPEIIQVPRAELYPDARHLPYRTAPVQTINTTATPISTGTVWEMLCGFTGQTVAYIANVSSGGRAVYGNDGSLLRYDIENLGTSANPNYYLQVWNSSHGTMPSSEWGTGSWQWRPSGGTFGGRDAYLGGVAYNYVHDGRDFFSLNVSIPSILGPRNARQNQTGSIQAVREDEYIIIGTTGANDEEGIAPGWMMALSLERDKEGTKLWEGTFTPPSSADRDTLSFTGVYPEYDMFLFHSTTRLKRFGYSLKTFKQVWEGEPEIQFAYYGMYSNFYEGILYGYGYGGVIYAYNVTTGDVLWTYEAITEGFESTYGGRYPIGVVIVADGKLYTVTGEHSPTQPLYRGPNLRCLDAFTGDELWKIQGWFGGMSPSSSNILMADGILAGLNFFDNQLYAFGRGPSAITVSAPQVVSMVGSSVVITGSVTDQTPTGRRDISNELQFSLKGTPAISDEDMADWMEYLYMQQAYPADAKGVEVVLETLDPNGNFYEIGRTTSDVTGSYGLKFTPEVPGDYQIFARFEGSAAYGPSSATTYLSIDEAPQATPPPTPPPESIADLYFVPATVGIIVAIIAVGLIIIVLMLRKR